MDCAVYLLESLKKTLLAQELRKSQCTWRVFSCGMEIPVAMTFIVNSVIADRPPDHLTLKI